MWWQYLLVLICTFAVDVVPFPLPPAFTVMILIQSVFKLNVWAVIFIGVAGSILGRYVLTLYIPHVAGKIFRPAKNEDVQYLGKKMNENKWKGQGVVLVYSLLPLPTTPLFIAGGMAKMKPWQIIPAFFIGKMISDTAAVFLGKFAVDNTENLIHGMVDWKSIVGLVLGIILIAALLFIDWRTLLQKKKLKLQFKIWK